jgi:predicted nucleic acid-binding protein
MGFIDAYALIALIAGEPAAGEVEALLRTGDVQMPLVNLAEVVDVLQRRCGFSVADIRHAIEPLELAGVLSIVASGRRHAWFAGALRATHYDGRTQPVSLADCFLLAHAVADDDQIVTSDGPLAAAARAEGVDVVALPSTTGKRP